MKTNLVYNIKDKFFDVVVWKVEGSMLYMTLNSGFWKIEDFRFLSINEAEKLFKFKKDYPAFNMSRPNEAGLNYILFN